MFTEVHSFGALTAGDFGKAGLCEKKFTLGASSWPSKEDLRIGPCLQLIKDLRLFSLMRNGFGVL